MGNGYGLGLTNGTKGIGTFMATGTYGNYISASEASYGREVGNKNSNSGWATNNQTLGVTTDPAKSGIALEKEPWLVFIAY